MQKANQCNHCECEYASPYSGNLNLWMELSCFWEHMGLTVSLFDHFDIFKIVPVESHPVEILETFPTYHLSLILVTYSRKDIIVKNLYSATHEAYYSSPTLDC